MLNRSAAIMHMKRDICAERPLTVISDCPTQVAAFCIAMQGLEPNPGPLPSPILSPLFSASRPVFSTTEASQVWPQHGQQQHLELVRLVNLGSHSDLRVRSSGDTASPSLHQALCESWIHSRARSTTTVTDLQSKSDAHSGEAEAGDLKVVSSIN